ncbi:MAG: hypothetical protein OIN90_04575 [Candidatus Methanoperedens sp.]|nr:hypothetical protein [Candidatus Methanoperedens sp.]
MKNKTIELGIRKIQKISKAHYINLPFIWMHNNNARQGDKLELSISPDGSLRIEPAHPAKNDAGTASRFGASND